jgi:high-affinity K+ transport system ATPase subunit B
MKDKPSSNKEILEDLIDKIKEIKRITQGKISLLAGYESENYLSEAKSNDNVSDNIVKSVRLLYEKAKRDPSILTHEVETIADKITIQDTPGSNQEFLIQILAKVNVLFSNEAEKTAQKEGRKATDVLREMDKAAMDEANILYKELLKKR